MSGHAVLQHYLCRPFVVRCRQLRLLFNPVVVNAQKLTACALAVHCGETRSLVRCLCRCQGAVLQFVVQQGKHCRIRPRLLRGRLQQFVPGSLVKPRFHIGANRHASPGGIDRQRVPGGHLSVVFAHCRFMRGEFFLNPPALVAPGPHQILLGFRELICIEAQLRFGHHQIIVRIMSRKRVNTGLIVIHSLL